MKKQNLKSIYAMLALVIGLSLSFTSCNDDGEDIDGSITNANSSDTLEYRIDRKLADITSAPMEIYNSGYRRFLSQEEIDSTYRHELLEFPREYSETVQVGDISYRLSDSTFYSHIISEESEEDRFGYYDIENTIIALTDSLSLEIGLNPMPLPDTIILNSQNRDFIIKIMAVGVVDENINKWEIQKYVFTYEISQSFLHNFELYTWFETNEVLTKVFAQIGQEGDDEKVFINGFENGVILENGLLKLSTSSSTAYSEMRYGSDQISLEHVILLELIDYGLTDRTEFPLPTYALLDIINEFEREINVWVRIVP